MALNLISPPAVEPVSLTELKEYLRVDAGDTSQDGTIGDLLTAAWAWAETYTQRVFVQQTWRLLTDFFPGYIDLNLAGQKVSSPFVSGSNAVLVGIRYAIAAPYPPLWRIVDFQYQDANGNVTPMTQITPGNPNGNYIADLQSNPARLTPPFGQMWPVARVVPNAVQVDFQCGYAMPVTVSAPAGSPPNPYLIDAGGSYTFLAADIGRPISIPGAAANGGTLNTIVAGGFSPPTGQATIRDAIVTSVQSKTALLVNNPNGIARHWSLIRTGIKFRVKADYDSLPLYLQRAKEVLIPVRDLRL